MGMQVLVLVSLLPVPLCAQVEDRKPSPFPDKERQAQGAASRPGKRSKGGARAQTAAETPPAGEAQTGKACFFSSASRGRTAGGDAADSGELVAAHATYPLGSRVTVTNLANGKAVEVRIVDRLPDSRRIISVSEAAARELGFYDAGIANVTVDLARQSADREKL